MQQFAALVAFGVVFIITRLVTTAAFQQLSPPPPGTRWQWWGTYASILIAIVVAGWVMAVVDRRMRERR
jgi:hypothetical protein